MLTACWQAERQAPGITVIGSEVWREKDAPRHDLVVVGPLREGKLTNVLRSLDPGTAVILACPQIRESLGNCARNIQDLSISLCAKIGRRRFCWLPENRCDAPKPFG